MSSVIGTLTVNARVAWAPSTVAVISGQRKLTSSLALGTRFAEDGPALQFFGLENSPLTVLVQLTSSARVEVSLATAASMRTRRNGLRRLINWQNFCISR